MVHRIVNHCRSNYFTFKAENTTLKYHISPLYSERITKFLIISDDIACHHTQKLVSPYTTFSKSINSLIVKTGVIPAHMVNKAVISENEGLLYRSNLPLCRIVIWLLETSQLNRHFIDIYDNVVLITNR